MRPVVDALMPEATRQCIGNEGQRETQVPQIKRARHNAAVAHEIRDDCAKHTEDCARCADAVDARMPQKTGETACQTSEHVEHDEARHAEQPLGYASALHEHEHIEK